MYNESMKKDIPNHVAIILDGNGRWAKARNRSRSYGHKIGFNHIKSICLYAKKVGIKHLSLYCFSTENWNRPKEEVDFLMNIPKLFEKDIELYLKEDISVSIIGRKDRIPSSTSDSLDIIEEKTKDCSSLNVNICFDYGSLWDLNQAIKYIRENNVILDEKDIFKYLSTNKSGMVDLLIRTGGEKRLSNFLLLESCYAELYFIDKYWPDFTKNDLDNAIEYYLSRDRRYGGIKK